MPEKSKSIVIATIKSWNIENARRLAERRPDFRTTLITSPAELTVEALQKVSPRYVFFPHWSWIIPSNIYTPYNGIAFHMTDLPFGRGGSPLQNLISRGIYQTKISAFRVGKGVDTGPIYAKRDLDISEGSADEIFRRVSDISYSMMEEIIDRDLKPSPQVGEPVCFARRRPEDSEIPQGLTPRQLYDYIRMLDGEGYPKAFERYGRGRKEFYGARLVNEKCVANVEFILPGDGTNGGENA